MRILSGCWLAAFLPSACAAPSLQVPLREADEARKNAVPTRPLYGKFLHITDFHPDRFYKVYASTSEQAACHRGQGPAGIYGAEVSDCDSPVALINRTLHWVGREFRDKIDFVVWTGDSARHDNDEDHPRNEKQVVGLNEFMVQKMFETFGRSDDDDEDPTNDFVVPIIPTFGNNDILPHNIFREGPNKWTRMYTRIWRQFIPEEQKHQFEQGGWFYVEAIRDRLAVFSINTIYFFKSNAAADGCAVSSEPGYQQMEWLRTQLQFMRDRGMKAILTGHVPPAREDAKWSWDETCWQKYTLWLRQYRDVVVTSLYGHFNYDHFLLQDFEDLRKGARKGKMPNYDEPRFLEDGVHAAVSSDYFTQLRDHWSMIPDPPESLDWPASVAEGHHVDDGEGVWALLLNELLDVFKGKKKQKRKDKEKEFFKEIGGQFAERFAASFVAASVVPNLYPTFRVYEYNITNMDRKSENEHPASESARELDLSYDEDEVEITKSKKYKFVIPRSPSKSAPPGPAYSPQTLSLIRYTQYMANLTHINNDFNSLSSDGNEAVDSLRWKDGKHRGKKPHDSNDHRPNPKEFRFQIHYDTKNDDTYQLPDLTMPNLVNLARRIGNFVPEDQLVKFGGEDKIGTEKDKKKKKEKDKEREREKDKQREVNKAWWSFVRRVFVETLNPEEIEEQFGG